MFIDIFAPALRREDVIFFPKYLASATCLLVLNACVEYKRKKKMSSWRKSRGRPHKGRLYGLPPWKRTFPWPALQPLGWEVFQGKRLETASKVSSKELDVTGNRCGSEIRKRWELQRYNSDTCIDSPRLQDFLHTGTVKPSAGPKKRCWALSRLPSPFLSLNLPQISLV